VDFHELAIKAASHRTIPDDSVAAPGQSGPGRLTIPLPPTGQPGMAEKRSNVVQVFFKCSL
jgi:hypothetical protein